MRGLKGGAPDRITIDWLDDMGACLEGIFHFQEIFPDGAAIDAASIRRAGDAGLNLEWVANNTLTTEACRAYREAAEPERRAYRETVERAERAYREAAERAERAYSEAAERARRACRETVDPARRAYRETVDPARRAYSEAVERARRAYRETVERAYRAYSEAVAGHIIDVLFRGS